MKKIMKKIAFIICLLCVVMLLLVAWIMKELNTNIIRFIFGPEKDDITKAIEKAVGEEVEYGGRSKEVKDGVEYIEYWYVLREVEDEKLLADMVNAVNEELEKQSEKGKVKRITLEIDESMYERDCYTPIVYFRNYDVNEKPILNEPIVNEKNIADTKLSYANIVGSDIDKRENDDSRYDDISMYTSIEGIKWLRISDYLAKQAEEEGIDLYEVWPELEYYEEHRDLRN